MAARFVRHSRDRGRLGATPVRAARCGGVRLDIARENGPIRDAKYAGPRTARLRSAWDSGDRLGVPAGEAGRRPQPWSPLDGHLSFGQRAVRRSCPHSFSRRISRLRPRDGREELALVASGRESQVAKNGFSEIERNKLSEFHQAAMGCAWRSTTLVRAPRQCSISVSVVWLPREKRTVDEASSGATPWPEERARVEPSQPCTLSRWTRRLPRDRAQ